VYKERGKLKKEGLLVTHQSLSFSNGQSEITLVKDQPHLGENVDLDVPATIDRTSDYDLPRLDKAGLMLMYDAFEQHKTPAHVTAKYGIHPEISQREYQRYLTMSSRDPFDLQNRLTSGIVGEALEIQAIVDKSTDNLLTNEEIISVSNFRRNKYAGFYVKKIILNPDIDLDFGLGRFVCSICHEPQAGVIFDRQTDAGSFTEKYLGTSHICQTCKSIEDKVFAQSNQKA